MNAAPARTQKCRVLRRPVTKAVQDGGCLTTRTYLGGELVLRCRVAVNGQDGIVSTTRAQRSRPRPLAVPARSCENVAVKPSVVQSRKGARWRATVETTECGGRTLCRCNHPQQQHSQSRASARDTQLQRSGASWAVTVERSAWRRDQCVARRDIERLNTQHGDLLRSCAQSLVSRYRRPECAD